MKTTERTMSPGQWFEYMGELTWKETVTSLESLAEQGCFKVTGMISGVCRRLMTLGQALESGMTPQEIMTISQRSTAMVPLAVKNALYRIAGDMEQHKKRMGG